MDLTTLSTDISPKKRQNPLLLLLLFISLAFPSSAQVVLIDGTLYQKVDLDGKIDSGDNRGSLFDGLYNDENNCYKAKASDWGPHSYLNIIFAQPITGKVLIKYDTYADRAHLPLKTEFRRDRDLDPNDPNRTVLIDDIELPQYAPNSPYKVTFTIPENEPCPSIQMRATPNENPANQADKQFYLRELEVLVEVLRPETVEIGGTPYELAYTAENVTSVPSGGINADYSFFNFNLGKTITGKVRIEFKATTDNPNMPTKVDFFTGVNNGDWLNPLKTIEINDEFEFENNQEYAVEFEIPKNRTNCNSIQIRPHSANKDIPYTLNDVKIYVKHQYDVIRNLSFRHTHGALSPYNKEAWGYEDAPISEPDWADELADTIEKRYGVKFPDFNYVDETGETPKENDGTLQAAHWKEYDIYVIPGDIVPLVPYNRMDQKWYRCGYVRWYNYTTDTSIDDKYFGYHVNPSLAWELADTENISNPDFQVGGTLGGACLLEKLNELAGYPVNLNYNNPTKRPYFSQFYVPSDDNDKSWIDMKVAADFTMGWDIYDNAEPGTTRKNNLTVMSEDGDGITIQEPPVNFRAIFNIHDGRVFAEELSGSAANNQAYIKNHRRIVSAMSNTDFSIRLDFQEPAEDNVYSNIYYSKGNEGYGRVCRFAVETIDAKTNTPVDQIFEIDNGNVDTPQHGYIIAEAGKKFNRFLKCDKEKNAEAGGKSYIVKIYGLDETGKRIRTADNSADLQIMEYVVTFEIAGNVSMQSMGDYLENLDNNGNLLPNAANLPRHTVQSLEQRFGEAYSKQDYDQYLRLADALLNSKNEESENKPRYLNEYFVKQRGTDVKDGYVNGGAEKADGDFVNGGLKSKLPIMWDRSDYVFPYNDDWSWNHYDICNHSAMTCFSKDQKPGGQGMFDVSYYMRHPKNYKTDIAPVDSTYKDAGFFFFVDAVYDPGTICRIPIEKPCAGTRIHASAWVCELNNIGNNWANVIFNFRAKMADGSVQTIYSYVPGKVPTPHEWYHIYFNFVPDFESIIGAESYYLSIENNCPSSEGADYCIDDFEIFLEKPDINLIQIAPICNTDGEDNVRILVECPFEMLVRSSGLEEAEEGNLYFCALDKEAYDKDMIEPTKDFEKAKKEFEETEDADAFEAASKKYEAAEKEAFKNNLLSLKTADAESPYGSLTFPAAYDRLGDYDTKVTDEPEAMGKENIYGEKCMYFFVTVDGEKVRVDQELIICAFAQANPIENVEGLEDIFNINDACGIRSDLRLQGAAIIKIDGVPVPDRENIICCENQRPVVQLSMTARPEEGKEDIEENYTEKVKDAYYDWFDGTYAELLAATLDGMDPSEYNLEIALSHFRQDYPNAAICEMPIIDEENSDAEKYTENDRNLIRKYCEDGKLHLRQSYYIFPEYHIGVDEDGNKLESITVYATALPIYTDDLVEDDNLLLCLAPVTVPMTIRNQAPVMLHGLGMDYPEAMLDVPLRVGLSQIKHTQGENSSTLWLPVRTVTPVTENVNTLVKSENRDAAYLRMPDQFVYLVGSNDPNYQSLNPDDYKPGNDTEGVFSGLEEVGVLENIIADKNNKGTNFVGIKFKNSFKPREGYYYVLRYSFEENQKEVGNQYFGEDAPCYGEDVVTIKIVPEYQMWTGEESDDYNDDRNWRRVSSGELLADNLNGLNDFVTDTKGANDNRTSYVPMDFTKVIVPDDIPEEKVLNLQELATTDVEVMPKDADQATIYQWASAYGNDIKYDMAAYLDTTNNVQCRPWYHNTCEQIHFNFGGEMLNQGRLNYQRAWVDMDTKPGKWYFLSMPLQDVYAGEFYLPSDSAVQKTPLFKEINFDRKLNDRFRPAVYQRGWNKGTANVYRIDEENPSNAAVTADWSRVYNDVLEKYTMDSNPGFSVKTDVTYMDSPADTVRFRFPKADDSYDYWEMDNQQAGEKNSEIPHDEDKQYKLNPSDGTMTATVDQASEYFLVGNPFICHLDLEEFFRINKGIIESQCWILNNGELTTIVPAMYADETGKAWRYLPPFQGFFVKLKDNAKDTSLTLNFNADMMATIPNDNILNLNDRVAAPATNALLITMSAEGESDSHIRIMLGEEGSDVAALFNADSENGMMAYGVSDGLATSIKYVDEIKKEEVGVAVKDDAEVKIRFNGDCLEGLLLQDKLTGEMKDLYDGMEYTISGSAAGRLYILASGSDVENGIALDTFTLEINGTNVALTAPAGSGSLLMQVYDPAGRIVTNVISESERGEVTLQPGVYVLKGVTDLGADYSAKIVVK